jgi:hypothetical protein
MQKAEPEIDATLFQIQWKSSKVGTITMRLGTCYC